MEKYSLGSYEKFLYYHTRFGGLFVLAVGILEPGPKYSDLTESIVNQAARSMQKRHPFLRGQLHLADSNPDQVYISLPEFTDSSTPQPHLSWIETACREELSPALDKFAFNLTTESLVWRLRVIQINNTKQTAICMCLPLFLTDGINISVLIVELVNIINALMTGRECLEMTQTLQSQPNMHEMSRKVGLFTERQQLGVDKLKLENSNTQPFLLDEKLGDSLQPSGTRSDLFRIESRPANDLVRLAKARSLKLTGVINAAILEALRDLYHENGLTFPGHVLCSIPANLRIRYQPNMDFSHMGHHVCLTTMSLDLSEERDFWQLAEYLNAKCERACSAATGALFAMSHDFEELDTFNKSMNLKVNENGIVDPIGNLCDLTFSNLGKWVWERSRSEVEAAFALKELYHGDTLCLEPCAVAAAIFHVNFWNGELQTLLSTNKRSLSDSNAARLRELFVRRLLSVL